MQKAENLKEYRREMQESLDNSFLRQALDTFAVAYRAGRARAFADFEIDRLVTDVACAKDAVLPQLSELFLEFKKNAEVAGVKVHFAGDAAEANALIVGIAKETGAKKIIKSKSMTAEETLLNHRMLASSLLAHIGQFALCQTMRLHH